MLSPTTGVSLLDYITAIQQGKPTHARLVFPVQNITLDDQYITLDGGISITDILNGETDLVFGSAVSRQVVVGLINDSAIFSGFDWSEEFHLDIGIEISGTTKWVTVGYFTGKRPDRLLRNETIDFVAYDSMSKFDVIADDFLNSISYPATMEDIYHDLCTYVGLGYSVGDELADSMAISYAESPFENGITCRALLSWIAEANCCYAKIDSTGKVKLTWFSNHTSDYVLGEQYYFDIQISETSVSVPDYIRIASSNQDGNNMIYPLTGTEKYEILDNPFLLSAVYTEKESFCTSAVARLSGVGAYLPTGVNAIGNWLVETGDIITVMYDNGSGMSMPIFNRTFSWHGGCNDTYQCTGNDKRETVSESAKVKYEEGAKLANKYTIQSGIDITNQGITISGQKYLKLMSGGVLDVQSNNFVLDSLNRRMITGPWTLDEDGLSCEMQIPGNPYKEFQIRSIQPSADYAYSIVTGEYTSPKAIAYITDLQENGKALIDIYPYNDSSDNLGYLGKTHPWKKIFAEDLDASAITAGNIQVSGNNVLTTSYLADNLTTQTSGLYALDAQQGYQLNQGLLTALSYLHDMSGATESSAGTSGFVPAPSAGYQNRVLNGGGNWVAGINWSGNLTANDDLDNYTAPGMYRCSAANAGTASNCPVTVAFTLIVIYGYSSTASYQFIYPSDDQTVYWVRRRYSSAWKSWVKYESTDAYVHLTGDETVSGVKWFQANSIKVGKSSSSRYHYIYFPHDANSYNGFIRMDAGNSTNQTSNRYRFCSYSPKSTADAGNTGFIEYYQLPAPTAGLAADTGYSILTTKSKVTIDQGGTGMGATTTTTTKSDVFGTTATSSVSSVSASIWGKVVSLHITVAASGSASFASLGTLVSKYRPAQDYGTNALPCYLKITSAGAVTAYHNASGGSPFVVDATYLTA